MQAERNHKMEQGIYSKRKLTAILSSIYGADWQLPSVTAVAG